MLPDTTSCTLGIVVDQASDPLFNDEVRPGKTKSLHLGQVADVDLGDIFF